jgi:steroid delta-isomerase-like uncharacterized protein
MSSSAGASGRLPAAMDAYTAAWNAHDAAAVTSFMTEDVVYEDVALGMRFEGRTAVQEFVASMVTTLSTDFRLEMTRSLFDGDQFAGAWTLSGTHDRADPEMGLPATGHRFEIRGVSIGRLRDGQIAENVDYWNMASFLMQVGLMPAPATPPAHV